MRRPTGDQEVAGSIPAKVGNILSWKFDHEIFSTVILFLPLIQEGQLSVSDERMCTILVNRSEDLTCPVNAWLGKLTALDMTPLGFFFFFFFFFFLIWVLRPFQEYFTYIEPIVHRRWAKTGEPGEKPPDHP